MTQVQTSKSQSRKKNLAGRSEHRVIAEAICEMFHPATVDQVQQLIFSVHKTMIGKNSILRVVRRLARRGVITAFFDRDPPEYMRLLDSAKCKDVRRAA